MCLENLGFIQYFKIEMKIEIFKVSWTYHLHYVYTYTIFYLSYLRFILK